MKIKIVSDGRTSNTHVIDIETGEELKGVTRVEWKLDAKDYLAECILTLHDIPIEIEADQIKTYKLSNKDEDSSSRKNKDGLCRSLQRIFRF